jgi:hypothetical protein
MDRDYAPGIDDEREVDLDGDEIDSPPTTIDADERLESEPDAEPGLDDERRA